MTDIISKVYAQDPEAAAVLIDEVLAGLARDEVVKAAPALAADVLAVGRQRVRKAKAGLARGYVSKAASGVYPDEDVLLAAKYLAGIEGWLEEVSKEVLNRRSTQGTSWTQRIFRDKRGRFTSVGAAEKPSLFDGARRADSSVPDAVRRYVVEETQADGTKRLVPQSGLENQKDDIDLLNRRLAWLKDTGDKAWVEAKSSRTLQPEDVYVSLKLAGASPVTMPLGDVVSGKWNERIGLDAMPTHVELVDSAGKPLKNEESAPMPEWLRLASSGNIKSALGTRPPEMRRYQALMNRLGYTGDALAEISPANKYARFMQLVGNHGPVAAEAIKPHLQRASYRYRGTERTPDRALVQRLNGPDGVTADWLKRLDAVSEGSLDLGALRTRFERSDDFVEASVATRVDMDWVPTGEKGYPSGESLRMGVRSDITADYLLRQLPRDRGVPQLSEAAGAGLPSHGVMIDSDGDLVAQAVGFGEDHYLPFDLSNMRKLRGGQYIRTRQRGGLTGEDIWASVFHGARSATVASRSGVFRIEFAPDFRGARGNSDKAYAMYDRYLALLATIANEDEPMYIGELDEQTAFDVETKVRRENRDLAAGALREKIRDAKRKKLEELRAPINPASIKAKAKEEAREGESESEAYKRLMDEAKAAQPKALELNGEGYYAALQALKAQFPYFIRSVEYEPLIGENADRGLRGEPIMAAGREGNGFWFNRRTNPVISQSRGRDTNYVHPGDLRSRDPYSRFKTSAATEPSTAPPTAPVSGGGTGSAPDERKPAGGSPEVTDPASSADTTSLAAETAMMKGQLTKAGVEKLANKVQSEFERMAAPMALDNKGNTVALKRAKVEDLSDILDSAKAAGVTPDTKRVLTWFASQYQDGVKDALRQHSDLLYPIFAESTVSDWDAAIGYAWEPVAGHTFESFVIHNGFFGSKEPDEALAALKNAAMKITEAKNVIEPFKEMPAGGLDRWEFRNQSGRAFSFPEITSLDNMEQVESYAKTNQVVASAAKKLGLDSNMRYMSYPQTVEATKAAQDALRTLDESRKAYQKSLASAAGGNKAMMAQMRSGAIAAAKKSTWLSDDQLAAVMDSDSSNVLDEHFETLQKARTLVEVSRAFDLLGGEGGIPKAGPAWVRKSARSSPRVHGPASPVSKAVAARRTANLPWVPLRRSSV